MDNLYDVARLEDFDFDGKTLTQSAKNPNTIYVVAIMAEWCGHCKSFVPEYDKCMKKMKGNDKVVFCMINGSGDNSNCRQSEKALAKNLQNIIPSFRGFPTMVIYKNGKLLDTYNGPRKCDDIKKYLEQRS